MTNDELNSKRCSKWFESALPDLIASDPMSIVIAAEYQDGTTGTSYYNCDTTDLAILLNSINDDRRLTWIAEHADVILDLLENPDEEGEDEDGLQGVNT